MLFYLMKLFFYSNNCIKCKNLWKHMKDINISKNYKTICVDNNNNLPDKVKQVPTIIDDTLSDILVGDDAIKYIKNLQFFNFPSNNFNNWNNKKIPKPKIIEDKKAYNVKAMENINEHVKNQDKRPINIFDK